MLDSRVMRCRAIVDLDAIRSNYAYLSELTGASAVLLCVVKADAYGHGAANVGRALAAAGSRHFAVASLSEAIELRDAGIGSSILVLDGVEPGEEREAALRGIEPVIGSLDRLRQWNDAAQQLGRRLSCHLLFNTGMNRLGIDFDPASSRSADALFDALRVCRWMDPRGAATHYASAEDFESPQTGLQRRLFARQVRALRAEGIDPRYVHSANSAAVIHRGIGGPKSNDGSTMVRPGLALYGYVNAARGQSGRSPRRLRPALEWRARILAIRDAPAGADLGYGATFRAPQPMRVGVLSVGYGDGLDWRLSNRGAVSIGGARCPIVGQVSMDFTMADLSAAPDARAGDEAVVLGSEPYDAQGMADAAGSIPYEVLCRISGRVPRQYVGDVTGGR